MASASDHRAHPALHAADCLILLPQRLPAAVETSIGPAHYPAECTQSDAFLQPSLRARYGRANSNSFLSNHFALPALTIAALYKNRWQVELFFKWIKQHLRIKQFYGTSENAVKMQI